MTSTDTYEQMVLELLKLNEENRELRKEVHEYEMNNNRIVRDINKRFVELRAARKRLREARKELKERKT